MLAKIDAKLTDRWIDCEGKKSQKIRNEDSYVLEPKLLMGNPLG